MDYLTLVYAYMLTAGINNTYTFFRTPHTDLVDGGVKLGGDTALRNLLISGIGVNTVVSTFWTWPCPAKTDWARLLATLFSVGLVLSSVMLVEHPSTLGVIVNDAGRLQGAFADFYVVWACLSLVWAALGLTKLWYEKTRRNKKWSSSSSRYLRLWSSRS